MQSLGRAAEQDPLERTTYAKTVSVRGYMRRWGDRMYGAVHLLVTAYFVQPPISSKKSSNPNLSIHIWGTVISQRPTAEYV
jgi:hypothetical protein